jgi:hypothetical protein
LSSGKCDDWHRVNRLSTQLARKTPIPPANPFFLIAKLAYS